MSLSRDEKRACIYWAFKLGIAVARKIDIEEVSLTSEELKYLNEQRKIFLESKKDY